ncbi:MAG: N-acylglucosamine 2-epimerase [Candidatus Glassbacteria bacterium]|nr:N-acylglucosamine 2-epimerase [Candidatus Glassbacteria bacterium]
MGRSFEEASRKYGDELFGNILPFWMARGIDREYGGFFTCFSNDGSTMLAEHKFTWSQGRFVWMLARLYRKMRDRVEPTESGRWLEAAGAGAQFLIEHARLAGGNCAFILNREGAPVLLDSAGGDRPAETGESCDLSIYADFFVIYGLAEYAAASGRREAYEFALDLFDHVLARLESGDYRTDPYPVPPGYKVHGEPMITLETAQELADIAAQFGESETEGRMRAVCGKCAEEIMENFRRPDEQVVLEMIGVDNEPKDTLLGRFVNPGHMIEDMWFMMHWADRAGDNALFAAAAEVVRWALELGWDKQFGGLPQFLDKSGEPPRGEVTPELTGHEMVSKLGANWSNKLWWPHSEAIYALLLAYERLEEPWMAEWFWRVHDYTLATFPNPDREVGEWIQIRDHRGRPESKVVALPVKDPFHITRALLLALPVAERLAEREG